MRRGIASAGRVDTRDVGGAPVDAGAMFLHGNIDNPLAAFLDAHEIAYESTGYDMGPIFDAVTGGPVEDGFLKLVMAMRGFESRVEDLATELPADASMNDAIEAYLASVEDLSDDDRRYASFALTQLLIELYESGPADLMSLRAYLDSPYEEYAGGNHVLPGGYVQVVDVLADGLDVRLNQPVSRIAYDPDGVTVATPSGELRGSHAIVTASVGVLQAGVIEFDPARSRTPRRPRSSGSTSATSRRSSSASKNPSGANGAPRRRSSTSRRRPASTRASPTGAWPPGRRPWSASSAAAVPAACSGLRTTRR